MEIEILKVKPWGKDQGDHVLINASDFDANFHELLDAAPAAKPEGEQETKQEPEHKATAAELKAALTEKGIAFKSNASKADLQALLDAAPAA